MDIDIRLTAEDREHLTQALRHSSRCNLIPHVVANVRGRAPGSFRTSRHRCAIGHEGLFERRHALIAVMLDITRRPVLGRTGRASRRPV